MSSLVSGTEMNMNITIITECFCVFPNNLKKNRSMRMRSTARTEEHHIQAAIIIVPIVPARNDQTHINRDTNR